MEIIILINIIIYLLFFTGLILFIISTIRRSGRWGINLKPIYCPKCKTQAPKMRISSSIQEFLWGGWTCTNCGCKMDKWGKEII
jgi:hypothetical protein